MPQRLDRRLELRVRALWGEALGVDADSLDDDGLVVLRDGRDFATNRRATVRTARGTFLLAAPTEVAAAAADPATYVADVAARARGTGLLHYFAAPAEGDPDARIHVLGAAHRGLLDELQRAAGAAATEEAE